MYNSFKELEEDIKLAKLKRDIAVEELKLSKHEFTESFQGYQWISTAFSAIKKYGILYLVRKILK